MLALPRTPPISSSRLLIILFYFVLLVGLSRPALAADVTRVGAGDISEGRSLDLSFSSRESSRSGDIIDVASRSGGTRVVRKKRSIDVDVAAQESLRPKDTSAASQLLGKILARFRLPAPPELSAYGLKLNSDKVYVKEATPDLFASESELLLAVDAFLLKSHQEALKTDADHWLGSELKGLLPEQAAEIEKLSAASKALLLQHLLDHPDAPIKGSLSQFSSKLNGPRMGLGRRGFSWKCSTPQVLDLGLNCTMSLLGIPSASTSGEPGRELLLRMVITRRCEPATLGRRCRSRFS